MVSTNNGTVRPVASLSVLRCWSWSISFVHMHSDEKSKVGYVKQKHTATGCCYAHLFFQRWHRHPNGGGRNEDVPGRAGQGQREYQLFSWPRLWSETRGLQLQHLTPIVSPRPLTNHHVPIIITTMHRRKQQRQLLMPGTGGYALHQVYAAKVGVSNARYIIYEVVLRSRRWPGLALTNTSALLLRLHRHRCIRHGSNRHRHRHRNQISYCK